MSGRDLRVVFIPFFSCILLSLALPISAFGLDPAKLAEAQALIDRAEKVSSLTGPDAVPFFLEVRFDRTPSKVSGKGGSYKLWWAAHNQWRAEAESGDLREIEIRNDQGLWLTENTDPKLDNVFSGARRFPFGDKILGWNEHIQGVHEHKVDGVKAPCVATERLDIERELCFDPKTGVLLRASEWVPVHTSLVARQFEPMAVVAEYRQYSGVGDKILPGEIRITTEAEVTADVRLVSVALAPKKPFANEMFAVPTGYRLWPACEQYERPRANRNFWRQAPVILRSSWFQGGSQLADGVRVVVGPDGKAQDVQLMDPVGKPSKEVEAAFMNQTYDPAICDGKPVVGMLLLDFSQKHR